MELQGTDGVPGLCSVTHMAVANRDVTEAVV
jgi:hypothetical protein